ncbi:MAG: hypothetical protein M3388_06270 [Acidobacteriota bacterium]|nr:hypothetical protein [Acidobacteriota bacterium]
MKTIFRFLALGILMTVFSAVTVTSSFAQGDAAADKAALYKTYMDNYDKPEIEKIETAIKAAKEYVEKYGANAADKEQVDYFKTAVPDLEKSVAQIRKAKGDAEKAKVTQALFTRFDTAVKGTGGKANPAETYASGKEIIAGNPDFLDVIIVLGSVGFDQAVLPTPVDTYNDNTIEYARMAIQKLEANTPSKTGNYGVLQYSYKNKDYPDGKSNALGWMNYNIGYITYYRQGKDNPAKKKEALPYLYKATQYTSFNQKNPFLYQTIGAWYLDEAIKIDKDRKAKITAASDKDTDETLAMLSMQKGYADRAIDAYARAYKFAKDDKNTKKDYTDNLYARLKELYVFRYDGKTEGIDQFVASVQNKPLPDPTTSITPVKDETTTPPATTSTATPTEPATSTATPAAPATSKPAAATPATSKPATTPKPAATPTKPTSMTTTPKAETSTEVSGTATKTEKTKAKKTTPKKKGSR